MERVNLATYKFARLTGLKERRERLREICRTLGLRGTILLAEEGINLFVAGMRPKVEELLAHLEADSEIGPLDPKWSPADQEPFRRMLVKIKREIISLGMPGIALEGGNARRISPTELKQWLDAGRDVVLVDTRNDYEVKLGTFEQAEVFPMDHFRQFPDLARQFPDDWRRRPVVTFCTGGIRCEKAAPLLDRMGFGEVYQLDGGILRYFEQVGRDHYRGDCFVFDQRVAVDATLRETDAVQCYACQAVLTPEEQESPEYVKYESCLYCYVTPAEQMARTLAERERRLAEIVNPLPGCEPYDNVRPVFVPAAMEGRRLSTMLAETVPVLSGAEWEREIESGLVLRGNEQVTADQVVRAGERYDHLLPGFVELEVNPLVRWVYEDAAVVVIDKPAPLPMHPSGRFNKNTLESCLRQIYAPQRLRPAHRLDANTTGLVVCGRTAAIAKKLQAQFAEGQVEKVYLAKVVGHPEWDETICNVTIAKEPAAAGIRLPDADGHEARTELRVIARLEDGTALVEARPLTGRTNQIRLHLWSLGHPVVGDPVYLSGGTTEQRQTLAVGDPPMCLHSWRLRLAHPISGEPIEWQAAIPCWGEPHRSFAPQQRPS